PTGVRTRPRLLAFVPPAADQFSASAVDFAAVWTALAKVWDGVADVVPLKREDAEQAFERACKVRLKEDLIDHLGKEVLTVKGAADAEPGDAEPNGSEMTAMMGAFRGMCIAVSLRSGAAFGESLEKLVRARGLHAARKTED